MAIAKVGSETVSLYKKEMESGKPFNETPLVIQRDKKDIEKMGVSVLSLKNIVLDLRLKKETPVLEASALTGENVISTLKKIIVLSLRPIKSVLKKRGANRAFSPAPAMS